MCKQLTILYFQHTICYESNTIGASGVLYIFNYGTDDFQTVPANVPYDPGCVVVSLLSNTESEGLAIPLDGELGPMADLASIIVNMISAEHRNLK